MPDEVARIGALSNGSNGQRSLESASLHFEPSGEILSERSESKDLLLRQFASEAQAERESRRRNPERRFCAKDLL